MNGDIILAQSPTISSRLGTASIAASAAALLVAMITLTSLQYFNLRSDFIGDSEVEARILARNVVDAVVARDGPRAGTTLETMHTSDSFNHAAVILPDGSVLSKAPATAHPTWKTLVPGYHFGLADFQIIEPIRHDGETIAYLQLTKTLENMHRQAGVYAANCAAVFLGTFWLMWVLMGRAKSAMAESEKKLQRLAHFDSVTDIWNRHAFNAHLKSVVAAAEAPDRWVAVLLLDLDNFKTVNDTLGHHTGDRLLKMVAQRLQSMLQREHRLFRLGGDEFAIILASRAEKSSAGILAAETAVLFSAPFLIDDKEVHVTCSIGVSVYPDDAADEHAIVCNADMAMYNAKSQGKNTSQAFSADMNDRIKRRLLIDGALRRALAHDEFTLHYQPQFRLCGTEIVGAEALLRWTSAELGSVSPAEFIPIAEESGLIVAIGDWVLETACAQIASWQRQGLSVPTIAINLSVKQLRRAGLADHIRRTLERYGVAPGHLELELTESMLMENVSESITQLEAVRASGVHLSIDDFGTGYSSMAYLKRLPLDKIKIDRTFIADLPGSRNDCQIVSAIIAMSHSLGLTVVAEGVENQLQAEFLKREGCDSMQGYLYGRPAPPESFVKLLAPGQRRYSRSG